MSMIDLATYAAVKKLLGGGGGGTSAYTAKSIEELPSNAVDGSVAIVESDSIVGKWELKDQNNPLDVSMLNIPPNKSDMLEIHGMENTVGMFCSFGFETNNDYGDFCVMIDKRANTAPLYYDGEFDDSFGVFEFYSDFTDYDSTPYITNEAFRAFLHANFNRLSGGNSLYIRENGQWAYKCEVA